MYFVFIVNFMFIGLNFIYFTRITKQVIQLILIMLVGTDVCGALDGLHVGGNRSARKKPTCLTWGHVTISHADHGYRTQVIAVRGEYINTAPDRQQIYVYMKDRFQHFPSQVVMELYFASNTNLH